MTLFDASSDEISDEFAATTGGMVTMSVLMGDSVACVSREATIEQVASELVADEVGLLVVGSPGEVVGVVSERDVTRAIAEGLDPATTPVTEIASTRLLWCDIDATVDEVAEMMMTEYVRHVLVEDAGELVGVVSARDLLGAYLSGEDFQGP